MERRSTLILVLLAVIVALVVAVKYLLPVVAPFVLGLFISCLTEPIIAGLEKKLRVPRRFGVPVVLLFFMVLLGITLTFGVARVYVELKRLLADLPRFIALAETAVGRLQELYSSMPPQLGGMLEGSIGRVGGLAEGFVRGAMNVAAGVPGFLLTLTIGTIASFFISRDKERIIRFLAALLPPRWRSGTLKLKDEITGSVMSYLRAQLLLVCLTTVSGTFLLLVIGIRHAVVLGLLLGFLDLLPLVGPSALFIPWVCYHLLIGNGWFALLLAGVFAVLQVTRQVVESLLVGERLGVHPLAALLAVWAGIQLFGASGFIFGPVILICVKALARGLQRSSLPGFFASSGGRTN